MSDHWSHWDPAVRELIDQARVEGIDEGRRQLATELLHQFIGDDQQTTPRCCVGPCYCYDGVADQ
jgi:hypothetical protein